MTPRATPMLCYATHSHLSAAAHKEHVAGEYKARTFHTRPRPVEADVTVRVPWRLKARDCVGAKAQGVAIEDTQRLALHSVLF